MAQRNGSHWLAACAASALLLAGVVVFIARQTTGAAASPGSTVPAKDGAGGEVTCAVAEPTLPRAEPDAESPPLILWGAGKARLFVDGRAAFSPPEAPLRFAPGAHEVRVEAEGHEPLTTRIRVVGWRPGLLHAQVDPELGISLVRLGVFCASCDPPVAPLQSLEGEPDGRPEDKLLVEAARALRKDDWRRASELLAALPQKARAGASYQRLAVATWHAAAEPQRARDAADALQGPAANELPALLTRLRELETQESARYAQVMLARWNRITEQHAAVLRTASGSTFDVRRSARRMEALSHAFNAAREQGDAAGQEQVFLAAEETVQGLLRDLLALNKGDCDFRARLVTATAGASP